jgi:hypothetical protein
MCFSATASFAASGVTGAAGIAAVGSIKMRKYLPLALVPVLFAVHQAGEGIEWLALSGRASPRWEVVGMYGFEIVAKVVWPFWVPWVALLLDTEPRRRTILRTLLVVGILESAAMAYSLATMHPTAQVLGGHIDYDVHAPPVFLAVTATLYPLIVSVPLLLSSRAFLRASGFVLLIVAGLTQFLYAHGQGSVWCYFDAWLSALIVCVVRRAEVPRAAVSGTVISGVPEVP